VPVVDVRQVRVLVRERLVPVRMGMRTGGREVMRVGMVTVPVGVGVLMLQGFVPVGVAMPLQKQQQEGRQH
jgi:hypothetical protein